MFYCLDEELGLHKAANILQLNQIICLHICTILQV